MYNIKTKKQKKRRIILGNFYKNAVPNRRDIFELRWCLIFIGIVYKFIENRRKYSINL